MKVYSTQGSVKTKKLGERLAKSVLKKKRGEKAVVLGLVGDLGGGKTTFLQGFARGLGIKEKVLSPTFVLMKRFPFSGKNFIHIDCYRIQKPGELLSLGFKEMVSDPDNIVAIEWADRIKKIMPKNAISLNFLFIGKEKRKIMIKSNNGK